ncbi:hypothetical protein BDQ12DRAFT_705609 [Crucibulum laeve]|uniref:DNA replication regulator Sld3 C-terminal domain-containing protein n=1 Tax=Crucibulum laeve TaxID=68775 RepID=A0A5C3LYB6_9AGAR|nr:hypothetical protein BDQ12DRAFT_705609 [Crucibulum laeve]
MDDQPLLHQQASSMGSVSDLHYTLESSKKVNWTSGQEKSLANDYPFDLTNETPDRYVARTYLQFLWLPESIMPLQSLPSSIRRVNAPSSSTNSTPHPLHALLEPLLLTTRHSSTKYHEELPRILADGGGAGEMEETMMWYALSYEKADGSDRVRDDNIEPWMDDKWRQNWLERLERREVQMQIMLYMLKLSLPGPPSQEESPKKRKKLRKEPTIPTPSVEQRLEAFMDKLSMWQLVSSVDQGSKPVVVKNGKIEDRDWMQIFCEDVVEPQFKGQQPGLCALLRSKVFPSSPFSDDNSAGTISRSPSPEPARATSKLRAASPASSSRYSSPAPSATSQTKEDARALARSRSRSLSISLAQERERATSAGPSKRRVLNREVSMSRVFKPRPKKDQAPDKGKSKDASKEKLQPKKDVGTTLVEDTPIKSARAMPRSGSQALLFTQSQTLFPAQQQMQRENSNSGSAWPLAKGLGDDDDDAWLMGTSPDVLLLSSTQGGLGDLSDGEEGSNNMEIDTTPSKPARKRK